MGRTSPNKHKQPVVVLTYGYMNQNIKLMSTKAGEDTADTAPSTFCLYSSSASQILPPGNVAHSPLKSTLVGNVTVPSHLSVLRLSPHAQ